MTKKLRIRHANGSTTIDNAATAQEVAHRIADLTGIPIQSQEWKCGYPPRFSTFVATEPLPFEVDCILVSQATGAGSGCSLEFPSVIAVATDDAHKESAVDACSSASSSATNPITLPFDIQQAASLEVPPPLIDPEGFVLRRVVHADNSCLFHSIAYAFSQPPTVSPQLRTAVAQAVLADPTTYHDAFLERPTAEYAQWIQESTSWGGQMELSILSRLLQTEIVGLDFIRNRHDIYGTEHQFARRIYVLYDGIHYDAVAYCLDPQLPPDLDQTLFSPHDSVLMEKAQQLCTQEHQRKAYTDVSSFTLRCLVCQQGLNGQREAAHHAQQTGHANFSEYG